MVRILILLQRHDAEGISRSMQREKWVSRAVSRIRRAIKQMIGYESINLIYYVVS